MLAVERVDRVERLALQLVVDARADSTGTAPGRRSCGTCTPWYTVGRKPLPQFELPPLGPFLPVLKTTKPGRFCDSLPRP